MSFGSNFIILLTCLSVVSYAAVSEINLSLYNLADVFFYSSIVVFKLFVIKKNAEFASIKVTPNHGKMTIVI